MVGRSQSHKVCVQTYLGADSAAFLACGIFVSPSTVFFGPMGRGYLTNTKQNWHPFGQVQHSIHIIR